MSHLVAILFSGNFRDKTPIASTMYKKARNIRNSFSIFVFKKSRKEDYKDFLHKMLKMQRFSFGII